ncbi:alanine dehydrogenase [Sedimentibacter acidaminivorans]|uniref:alanine dehydrogenase n=1 Tax=Sedimentibacter acidaminivorans TaxID=913099 RepID=A0ABS4GGH2_9FIRM|nr:alanine dehydrogenase [Sedimentibacter acidaminivorans]MBP1926776.1 alanine dehydrogenase [Sedimentibacter acidaminivorans]
MIIGVPKEIKNKENRVAAIPATVAEFVNKGHKVYVENNAGLGSGFSDEDYKQAGAIIADCETVYKSAEMIYKVKEIFPQEYKYLRENLILFTYIHSNAHLEQTQALLESKVIGIAYEDVEDKNGRFPLLKPMSELAGKGSFLAALHYGQSVHGGKGILFNRICGVETPTVTIIGCGESGMGAAELAASFGNNVKILDVNKEVMNESKSKLPSNVEFLYSNRTNLLKCLKETDVLINCILWNKTRKDHLVYKEDLKLMKGGAIIIDVACDDNGAIETSHSTSHDDPIYYEEGILHYCVDNIPSAFSRTASISLANATLPYAMEIANKGCEKALIDNKYLLKGLTCYRGKLTLAETAIKHNLELTLYDEIIKDFK